MTPTQPSQAESARREIGKWLNEEQTAPLDRVALAQLCAGFDVLARPQEVAAPVGGAAIIAKAQKDWDDAQPEHNRWENLTERSRLLLVAKAASRVPHGWQPVPVEPTPEMKQKAMSAWLTRQPFEAVYAALLAASPSATQVATTKANEINGLDAENSFQVAAVPEGWKLVPVNPTEEMLDAAADGDRAYTLRNFGAGPVVMQGPEDHYTAMLAASPAPKQGDAKDAERLKKAREEGVAAGWSAALECHAHHGMAGWSIYRADCIDAAILASKATAAGEGK